MNLCLCRKPRWLNSSTLFLQFLMPEIWDYFHNFLSLPPHILYITGLIDLTFKMDLGFLPGFLVSSVSILILT